MKKKLLYFITEDWFFCSHFIDRAVAVKNAGYEVFVVTKVGNHQEEIQNKGIKLIPVKLRRSGTNPIVELKLVLDIIRIYWAIRPHIVHHIAFKPIIYGSIAAIICRIKHIVNAPVGMGYVYISKNLRARFLKSLIRLLLKLVWKRKNSIVIVENQEDKQLLVEQNLVSKNEIYVIKGAGVDLNKFHSTEVKDDEKLVILPARMLWDKGVGEFVEAAEILNNRKINTKLVLIGDIDAENPNSISKEQLYAWNKSGIIEWWGYQSDMPDIYRKACLVCLPSYREGLPKSLIEAAASGRAIVATDVVGCREVVIHDVNGLLVPPHDSNALAEAIYTLLTNEDLLLKMGENGRKLAEMEFSSEYVIRKHLDIYDRLL